MQFFLPILQMGMLRPRGVRTTVQVHPAGEGKLDQNSEASIASPGPSFLSAALHLPRGL